MKFEKDLKDIKESIKKLEENSTKNFNGNLEKIYFIFKNLETMKYLEELYLKLKGSSNKENLIENSENKNINNDKNSYLEKKNENLNINLNLSNNSKNNKKDYFNNSISFQESTRDFSFINEEKKMIKNENDLINKSNYDNDKKNNNNDNNILLINKSNYNNDKKNNNNDNNILLINYEKKIKEKIEDDEIIEIQNKIEKEEIKKIKKEIINLLEQNPFIKNKYAKKNNINIKEINNKINGIEDIDYLDEIFEIITLYKNYFNEEK